MLTKIVKRDGREVSFDREKIAHAIFKAAEVLGGHDYAMALELATKAEEYIEKTMPGRIPTVEEVQDVVEHTLVENGHSRTAKEYILYRAERSRVREMKSRIMRTMEELTFKAAEDNDNKRENANIDGDTAMGTMLKYGSESAKQFYKMYVLNPKHADAHIAGDIHIHDLDFLTLTTTCCQIDIIKLFQNGFSTGHGFLREPNDINSYSALACIAIQSNQNDQHGGQSIPNFDYGMAKGVEKTFARLYVRNLAKACEIILEKENLLDTAKEIAAKVLAETGLKPRLQACGDYLKAEAPHLEKLVGAENIAKVQRLAERYANSETDRATYQAMEALVHNLNTMHSRAGAQVPFSSINYGTDTSPEGRLVIKNILLANDEGLGNGETPIFPIHIFKVKEGVSYNPEDPNYDLFKLACKVSAKRLFPNFSFLDAPYNLKYYKKGDYNTEVSYMGCRTRVMANVHDPERETTCGRGNLSFTSINLPRIAMNSHGSVDSFFEELDRKITLTIEQLTERYNIQAAKKVRNYPFLMGQGVWLDSEKLGPDDFVGEVLKHGTLSVGFIGLAECLKALIGKHHGESQEAQNLGLEIIGFMRRRLDEQGQKDKLNFTLIATPGEGLSGRFTREDKKKYGIIEGVTDREYYTNSFHIPVYYEINAFEKIKKEAPYHNLTNAGHITYVELDGDPLKNLDAFEAVIRCMKESGVGYGSVNHPVDRDPVCGYTGIIDEICPRCGRREGEGVSIEKLKGLGVYRHANSDTIGYHGDVNEELERLPNPVG